MSVGSEVLRRGHSRLLRAWLAVATVLVAAVLALVLWTSFGTSNGGGGGPNGEPGVSYDIGQPNPPIQVGDFVCHQCR